MKSCEAAYEQINERIRIYQAEISNKQKRIEYLQDTIKKINENNSKLEKLLRLKIATLKKEKQILIQKLSDTKKEYENMKIQLTNEFNDKNKKLTNEFNDKNKKLTNEFND